MQTLVLIRLIYLSKIVFNICTEPVIINVSNINIIINCLLARLNWYVKGKKHYKKYNEGVKMRRQAKTIIWLLSLLFIFLLFSSCGLNSNEVIATAPTETLSTNFVPTQTSQKAEDLEQDRQTEQVKQGQKIEPLPIQVSPQLPSQAEQNEQNPTPTPIQTKYSDPIIDEDGSYTKKDDVALYIHMYGRLPINFITKSEAKSLGWSGGSLETYAPGKCIGGDHFGNYEGLLPEKDGRKYTECDIDTLGASSRGSKRIVFSNDGLIFYTSDHYESFTLLYGEID